LYIYYKEAKLWSSDVRVIEYAHRDRYKKRREEEGWQGRGVATAMEAGCHVRERVCVLLHPPASSAFVVCELFKRGWERGESERHPLTHPSEVVTSA
jgi:hypothetical protein